MIEAQAVSVSVRGTALLEGVEFLVESGQWLMVIGPNGAGKTTLLRAMSGIIPYAGSIKLEGREIRSIPPKLLAKSMAMVEQSIHLPFSYTAEQVVSMGRYVRHGGMLQSHDAADREAIDRALAEVNLMSLRHRNILTLSGGERQRVFLAQAICQQPALLLLDEPANHLDIQQQQQMFPMLQSWLRDGSRALVTVMHDLSLALQFGSHFLVLGKGKQHFFGEKAELLSSGVLDEVWHMDLASWRKAQEAGWRIE